MAIHYRLLSRFSRLLIVMLLILESFASGLVTSTYAGADSAILIDVPFISQVAFKGAVDSSNKPYLLGNSKDILLWTDGCGVASLAMVYAKWGMPTCLPCLNDALKKSGGFSGALLRLPDKPEAVAAAGAPFIKGIRNISTSNPKDYKKDVDAELLAGRPVIAFIDHAHFVVITGIDTNGGYLVNDPWKKNEAEGKNIPIEKNLTKLGFDSIRQFNFIYPSDNAPTNGIIVRGAIQSDYFARGGSKGIFGNPISQNTEDTMFMDRYPWQKFENGVMLEINGRVRSIDGALWKKVQELGGLEKTGLPLNSEYSYWSGGSSISSVDLEKMTLKWSDKKPADQVEILYPEKSIRVEFFSNNNLSGQPVHTSLTDRISYDWDNAPPIPWLSSEHFSIRWHGQFTTSIGWFRTFRVQAGGRYKVYVDGKLIIDGWDGAPAKKSTRYVGRGKHSFTVEFAKHQQATSMAFDWSAWPSSLVFAGASPDGPVSYLPASVTDYLNESATQAISFSEPDQPVRQLMEAIASQDRDRAIQTLDPADQFSGKLLIESFQKATELKNVDGRVGFDEMDYLVSLDGEDHATVTVDGIADFYNSADELTDSQYFSFDIPVIRKEDGWYVSLDLRKAYELLKEYQTSE